MDAITFKSTKQQLVITIDKDAVGQDFLLKIQEMLEIERLVQKLDFDESLLGTGEEIVQSWWDKNQDRLLNPHR
ncbi:MAG: hypothetical protein EPO28_03860 [Saprospiraceae bacterium]|nr:MAG: hypothetical protein EPO28_03860 [Saprospiraceae bacterium]